MIYVAVQLYGDKHHKTVIQNKYAAEKDVPKKKENGGSRPNSLSINVRGESDAVLMRKQIARKRAKKAIEDAWAGDRKIDADLDRRKERLCGIQDDISRRTGYIMAYEETKARLREEYDIDENSEEQKALLEKREQSLENPEIVLTQEEQERLAEIDEYEARVHEIDATIHEFRTEQLTGLQTLDVMEDAEIASITAIHVERTKFDEMQKAQKAAEKMETAAGTEVFDMLIGEAKDHIDETLEERREEAREKAEKEGREEEKLEARKTANEIRSKQPALESSGLESVKNPETESDRIAQEKEARKQEDILAEVEKSSTGTASTSSQTRIEIKQMLHKMNLLEEDLKGLEVDDSL